MVRSTCDNMRLKARISHNSRDHTRRNKMQHICKHRRKHRRSIYAAKMQHRCNHTRKFSSVFREQPLTPMYTPSIASNMRSFAERGGAEGADMCDANLCVRAARAGLRLHALQPNQCSINGAAWVAYSVRTGCAVPKGQSVLRSVGVSRERVHDADDRVSTGCLRRQARGQVGGRRPAIE